jgi:hypothetical protein
MCFSRHQGRGPLARVMAFLILPYIAVIAADRDGVISMARYACRAIIDRPRFLSIISNPSDLLHRPTDPLPPG